MKTSLFAATLTLGVSFAHAATTLPANKPGVCASEADCKTYGDNYACVSVTSSVPGLENLSMCIPGGTVCSGKIAGACPTFSAWPKEYRVVQPVCALVPILNCKKTAVSPGGEVPTSGGTTTGDGTTTSGSETKASATTSDDNTPTTSGSDTVDCYVHTFTSGDTSEVVEGIYQCVDYATYLSKNYGHIQELTDAVTKACSHDTSTNTLCSSQGTCAPASSAQEYACRCNKGYDGTPNCASVTSNECSSLGQCGTLGTCTVPPGAKTGLCACKAGSTGDQCTKCDMKSDVACNKHGTCSTEGVCTCDKGYTGTFCGDSTSTSTPTPATPTTATTTTKSASSSLPSILVTVLLTGIAAVAIGNMMYA